MMVARWGSGQVEIAQQSNAPHEACLLHLNCDKAHQLMQWQPRWNVERAVAETVSWYRGVHEGRSALEISSKQITEYMND